MESGVFETRPSSFTVSYRLFVVGFFLLRALCTPIVECFRGLRNFLRGSHIRRNAITSMARSPLSSFPREGGDVRGGSFRCFYLGCGLPRWNVRGAIRSHIPILQ